MRDRISRVTTTIENYPDKNFSVGDISIMSGASKTTVRRVLQALGVCRYLKYQEGAYLRRNWSRRPGALRPSDDILYKLIEIRRKERKWLARSVNSGQVHYEKTGTAG